MIFSSRFFGTVTGEDSDQGVAKMAMEAGDWKCLKRRSSVQSRSFNIKAMVKELKESTSSMTSVAALRDCDLKGVFSDRCC